MDQSETVGSRVAALRKIRGLKGRQLADRAHVSYSLLSKVEAGQLPASPAFISAVARVLRTTPAELNGQPYRSGDRNMDAVHDLVPELRRELAMYGLPPDDELAGPPALPDLAARVVECSRHVHDVDYLRVGADLPPLLADLRAAAAATTGTDRVRVLLMLRETYDNAKRFAYDLGYADLGALAVTLEEQVAIEAGDPLAVALARAVRAWTLTGAGAFDAAYRLLVDTADGLGAGLVDPASEADEVALARWSVYGFLHLQAGLARARVGDPDRTWEHYGEALDATARVGRDRDDYGLAFGPANTGIWGVGLAVELQDGPGAMARAEQVTIPDQLPRARAGHHYMDLARGCLYNGDHRAALESLQTARRIAPQQTRYHPQVRETVHALARQERRSTESLRSFANWVGIED